MKIEIGKNLMKVLDDHGILIFIFAMALMTLIAIAIE